MRAQESSSYDAPEYSLGNLVAKFTERRNCAGREGTNNDVHPGGAGFKQLTADCTQATSNFISRYGWTHCFREDEAKSRRRIGRCTSYVHDRPRSSSFPPTTYNSFELVSGGHAIAVRQHQRALESSFADSNSEHEINDVTVGIVAQVRTARHCTARRRAINYAESSVRPLRRRAPRIARPARVRMRKRNPCTLARRRLFG